jgi:hypothetical protein
MEVFSLRGWVARTRRCKPRTDVSSSKEAGDFWVYGRRYTNGEGRRRRREVAVDLAISRAQPGAGVAMCAERDGAGRLLGFTAGRHRLRSSGGSTREALEPNWAAFGGAHKPSRPTAGPWLLSSIGPKEKAVRTVFSPGSGGSSICSGRV